MRRRDFITALGGTAAALPFAARAQQSTPVVGFLDTRSSEGMGSRLAAFRLGLKESGFIEGDNVRVEYRWAENNATLLSTMAADLVRLQPAVIVTTGGPPAAFAAQAATKTIPIVFLVGADPTKLGLSTNLARPSGNLTGINLLSNEMEAKRLELLHRLVPHAVRLAVLVNSADATNTETTLREVGSAARNLGLQIQVWRASTPRQVTDEFARIQSDKPDALFVGASAFLNSRRVQLTQLAAFHRLPASYNFREGPEVGGLMSYGPSILDAFRQWGAYAGRILRGASPADLPIVQASKFELVINTTTAKLLGLTVPSSLLALADEVIE